MEDLRIEKYLLGQLEGKELSQFISDMKNNIQLQKEVEMHKLILEGVDSYGNSQLKSRLKEISKQHIIPEKKVGFKMIKLLIPAAAAILITLVYFGLNIDQKPSSTQIPTDALIAQVFEPIKISNTRSSGIDLELNDYNNANYENAILVLESWLVDHPEQVDVSVALANSYFKLGNYSKSIEILKPIITNKNPLFEDQAKWYSALALLKSNDVKSATSYLIDLKNDKNADFSNEAAELLSKLDN